MQGGMCHALYQYVKANNKYKKDYEKNKESLHLKYCDVNNLYKWTMSQKFLVDSFKWVEETSQYNEDFIKSHNDGSNIGYLIDVDVQYLEIFTTFAILPFFLKEWKLEKLKNL